MSNSICMIAAYNSSLAYKCTVYSPSFVQHIHNDDDDNDDTNDHDDIRALVLH